MQTLKRQPSNGLVEMKVLGFADAGELEIRLGPANRKLRADPVSVALRAPHRLLEPLAVN